MKDMVEAYVILDIKILRSNDWIILSQSHYVEKILEQFNILECNLITTPMDVMKLLPNEDSPMSQLSYSKNIGSLMYAMTSIRHDLVYAF